MFSNLIQNPFASPPPSISVDKQARFEDVQSFVRSASSSSSSSCHLINTLPLSNQDYLIKHTLEGHMEERLMNDILKNNDQKHVRIIVYGTNNFDESAIKKRHAMERLGFENVMVYSGGLFEWSLLQDIFGMEEFPTSRVEKNILLYKP